MWSTVLGPGVHSACGFPQKASKHSSDWSDGFSEFSATEKTILGTREGHSVSWNNRAVGFGEVRSSFWVGAHWAFPGSRKCHEHFPQRLKGSSPGQQRTLSHLGRERPITITVVDSSGLPGS